jgi:hypothetical protein
MACHAGGSWEAAPVVFATVICFASSVGFSNSLVFRDQMEVCLLSQ